MAEDKRDRKPEFIGNIPLWEHFNFRDELLNFLLLVVGSFICASAISIVYIPLNISMGGVSGIATIIYLMTGSGDFLSLGTLSLILNIPILLLGWKYFGFRMVYRSIIGTVVYSFMIDLTERFMGDWYQRIVAPLETKPDGLVFAISGGVAFGIGLGLIFRGHYTTGGSDILAIIATKHIHNLTVGQFLFAFDVVVVSASVVVSAFGSSPNIVNALYAFIALYLSGRMIDLVLVGNHYSQACLVISDKSEEIAEIIIKELDRGGTFLEGRGIYTGERKDVLLVVLENREIPDLKKAIHLIDPAAFVIVLDAKEVTGEGFGKRDII